ncbi:MAG: sortase [Chloroflexi bacterium]|nr:sortase [Chloroflexota bacterium]
MSRWLGPRGFRRLWLLGALIIFAVFVPNSSAFALDVWLITDAHRILVIRNVERNPVQEVVGTHNPVPNAAKGAFGDLAYAMDGHLYGISMEFASAKAKIYRIDLDTGAITAILPELPYEYGNSLEYHPRWDWMFHTGAIQTYSPYTLMHNLYVMGRVDPVTSRSWYDFTGDPRFPEGFGADFTFTPGYIYAIWGRWVYSNSRWVPEHYLLRFPVDDAGNPTGSYEVLGESQAALGESIWGLASDGQTVYASTPTALYRVDISGSTATFHKLLDYRLLPDEQVTGATVRWADASLDVAAPSDCEINQPCTVTWTLRNDGPFPTSAVEVSLQWPQDWDFVRAAPQTGTFDPNTGVWTVPDLEPGQAITLTLTLNPQVEGDRSLTGAITLLGAADPDSIPAVLADRDDYADGLADDDEAQARIHVSRPERLPDTGFAPPAYGLRVPSYKTSGRAGTWQVEIPRLGLQVPVWAAPRVGPTWDVAWLTQALGWLQDTGLPGQPGNAVLTGHVWLAQGEPGPLAGLSTLRYDDAVYVTAWGTSYEYRVRRAFTVAADAVEAVLQVPQAGYAWLTLVTCAGYQPDRQVYAQRQVVQAVLVTQP